MTVRIPDHFSPLRRAALLGATSLVSMPVLSQFRVEISGVGMTQLPISVAAFRGEEALAQRISAIVQADLERSGQFRPVDAAGVVTVVGTPSGRFLPLAFGIYTRRTGLGR